jgi:hypothetical protein
LQIILDDDGKARGSEKWTGHPCRSPNFYCTKASAL